MEFKWVVEESITISDFGFKYMTHVARTLIREQDYKREEALTAAVRTYIMQQENYVYSITHEVFNQIKNEVNKRLT